MLEKKCPKCNDPHDWTWVKPWDPNPVPWMNPTEEEMQQMAEKAKKTLEEQAKKNMPVTLTKPATQPAYYNFSKKDSASSKF